jgi:alpha-glucosidase
MAADRPFIYEGKFPEAFEFIKNVPTNFEKTLPLQGEIGDFYIVARKDRDSEDWYIGGVTDQDARNIEIGLEFLDEGLYKGYFYLDSNDAHFRDNPYGINIYQKDVRKTDKLNIYLAPGGGFAIRLKKL